MVQEVLILNPGEPPYYLDPPFLRSLEMKKWARELGLFEEYISVCEFISPFFNFNLVLAADPPPVYQDCTRDSISIDLPMGEANVMVNWQVPTAADQHGVRILVTLVTGPSPPAVLGPGMTDVVYEARSVAGSVATCAFEISVYGMC